jgi:hypothetical protein
MLAPLILTNEQTLVCVWAYTIAGKYILVVKSAGIFKSTVYQVSAFRRVIIYCSENMLELACGNAKEKHTSFYLNSRCPKKIVAVF